MVLAPVPAAIAPVSTVVLSVPAPIPTAPDPMDRARDGVNGTELVGISVSHGIALQQ